MAVSPGIFSGIQKGAYKVAHFATAYLNVPPNKHRLYNAVGLTVGLFGGRYMMDILVGQKPNGDKVHAEDVPLVLKPLHGVLHYDHFSDDPKYRWFKVVDQSIPAILAGIGAGVGSDMFFKNELHAVYSELGKRRVGAAESAAKAAGEHTIITAEREALHHQDRVWSKFSSLAAVFGSASGFGLIPSWLNYSSTLGTKFTLNAERAMVAPWLGKFLRKHLLNSHSLEPYRPNKLLASMIDHVVHNPAGVPQNMAETVEGLLKTWFRDVTPEQIENFKNAVLTARDEALKGLSVAEHGNLEKTEKAVRKHLQKLFMDLNGSENEIGNLEQQLIAAGIDPRTAAIGDTGMFTTFARWVGDIPELFGFKGVTRKIKDSQKLMIQGIEQRNPGIIPQFGKHPHIPDLGKANTASKIAAGAFIGTGAGTIAAIGMAKDAQMTDLDPKHIAEGRIPSHANGNGHDNGAPVEQAESKSPDGTTPEPKQSVPGKPRHVVHAKRHRGLINGQILDTAEGITGMFNAGIGLHRVHCAVGLWIGSFLGDELMKALTGWNFQGKKVNPEELWSPLRKLHQAGPGRQPPLYFNPHSDATRDKWMQIFRWGVPAIMGTMAVIEGSKLFFQKRTDRIRDAKYLDDVDDKAAMAQSKPWSYTSAISGLFGFPTGLPMLPLVNYSTNLGTRFSMGSNRKVALPVVGKIWSNNPTLFPYGPPGMIDLMIKEAVHNKSYNPELLETYAIGVLKPWFENVTPQQVEDFVMHIHKIRDKFFKEGGVPEQFKAELNKEMKSHLHGAGLESTLRDIGLDPAQAHIGNNGLSGTIAEILGAKKPLEKIKSDYVASYTDRLKKQQEQDLYKGSPSPGLA